MLPPANYRSTEQSFLNTGMGKVNGKFVVVSAMNSNPAQ